MVLIQLLLPASFRDDAGHRSAAAELGQTRTELANTFDGVTAYMRSPAKGLWTSPDGDLAEDDVVMVEVVTSQFDRRWWGDYSATLAARFHQQAIHIRALALEVLDPGAAGLHW